MPLGALVIDLSQFSLIRNKHLLSYFCTVYAIEASKLAEQTKKVVEENKMTERIYIINSKVEVGRKGIFCNDCKARQGSVPVETKSRNWIWPRSHFHNRKSLVMKLIQCTYKFK